MWDIPFKDIVIIIRNPKSFQVPGTLDTARSAVHWRRREAPSVGDGAKRRPPSAAREMDNITNQRKHEVKKHGATKLDADWVRLCEAPSN